MHAYEPVVGADGPARSPSPPAGLGTHLEGRGGALNAPGGDVVVVQRGGAHGLGLARAAGASESQQGVLETEERGAGQQEHVGETAGFRAWYGPRSY